MPRRPRLPRYPNKMGGPGAVTRTVLHSPIRCFPAPEPASDLLVAEPAVAAASGIQEPERGRDAGVRADGRDRPVDAAQPHAGRPRAASRARRAELAAAGEL